MVGGSYDSFLSYEPFPFDIEYLNTKIPTDSLLEAQNYDDSGEGTTAEAAGKSDRTESAASGSSGEEMTSSGPILPPSPPNDI